MSFVRYNNIGPGAKIYPFNPVAVEWFIKWKNSSLDDVNVPSEVAAADADGDLHVTLDEMRAVYRKAQLVTADMNFSISHSIGPAVTTPMAGTAGCLTGSSWANRKSTTR